LVFVKDEPQKIAITRLLFFLQYLKPKFKSSVSGSLEQPILVVVMFS
jgi:hypothetical protein